MDQIKKISSVRIVSGVRRIGKYSCLLLGLFWVSSCATGNIHSPAKGHYTVQSAHSHNDYEQVHFFKAAYEARFGSMEADIFLTGGKLLVAHNEKELDAGRTLAAMYLAPLARHVRENGGYPYRDHNDWLELLIDLKDPKDSPAYEKTVELIRSYPSLGKSRHIRFTFTGNIPDDIVMAKAGAPFCFDGVPGRSYSKAAMKNIYMLSDNFARYSNWKGKGPMAEGDYQKLLLTVKAAHKEGKKIRFWNAPDDLAAWQLMERLGVDYINTDKIGPLSDWLNVGPELQKSEKTSVPK